MIKKISLLIIGVCSLFFMMKNVKAENMYTPMGEICEYSNEILFMADSEKQANEICEKLGYTLYSYNHGVGSFLLDDESNVNKSNPNINPQSDVKLYPNYKYVLNDKSKGFVSEVSCGNQWHINSLNMYETWEKSTGKGIKVAVIDSGIDPMRDSTLSNIVYEASVIDRKYYGVGKSYPIEYYGSRDNDGHGTHVAGIIGAKSDDGSIMGIAPDCSIYSIKVLEKTPGIDIAEGYSRWIAEGINLALELDVDVINMSLGGRFNSTIEDEAIEKAIQKGIVVVCSAGNGGKDKNTYVDMPARSPYTIAVAAGKHTDMGIEVDDYSSYGDAVDFLAPGTDILSTYLFRNKTALSGTSMSSAVVSGVVALVKSADNSLDAFEIKTILMKTAIDRGEPGKDIYNGYGMINPLGAVTEALEVDHAQDFELFANPVINLVK